MQMAVVLTFHSLTVKRILTWIQKQLDYILNKSYIESSNGVRQHVKFLPAVDKIV
jgi:hypothetical protein